MRLSLLWCFALIAFVGCRCDPPGFVDPQLEVSVAKQGTDYTFSFKNCGTKDQLNSIYRIRVMREGPPELAEKNPSHCQLQWTGDGGAMFSSDWKYGEARPGYLLSACSPLQPGQTYDVYVNSDGVLTFTVLANGELRIDEPACQ